MNAKLDHIAIVVRNAEVAKKWFDNYLGFNEFLMSAPMKATGTGGTRHLICNSEKTILELIEYNEPEKTCVGAIQHLGFIVDCVDDFYTRLKEDGIIQEETIKDMGKAKILYFIGIDNVGIELIEKRDN